MTRIKAGEIFINYSDSGKGDAFLFIPGLTGILDAWDFQIPHFSKQYRCISFDHRGTGESDKPLNAYSTDLIAKDAIALMDTLDIDKAFVAGTSTGGCVLQNLALDYPDRIKACIFSNTWTKADEYMTRVQTSRKHIAQSFGREEYIKFSSLWTAGWTQFKKGGKVKSVANRMVIFDNNLLHAGVTCTDEKCRVVMNFNYDL